MTAAQPGRLVALVTHARHVSAVERESFGFRAREWSARRSGFVLETCHRVEAYGVLREDSTSDCHQLPEGGQCFVDESVVRHAIAVAVGRDSVVVGEDQVLHQLRAAIATARASDTLDPVLERLFTVASRAGRTARSWRQGPSRSLADVAIEAIQRRAGPLHGRELLVVGAGQMSALAARSGLLAGATVSIASRTPARAEALATRFGGRARPFDPGSHVGDSAGIIIALRGVWPTSAATDAALAAGEAIVVDLSVPPAVAEYLAIALGDRFVSADALALFEGSIETPKDEGATRRLDMLVQSKVAEFLTWFDAHDRRAAAEALAERAESERVAELAELWRRLPRLDPEARHLIDGMSRHLATRLLREPLERLGRDPDGRHERAIRELFGL